MNKFKVGDFARWDNMPWHEDSANISKLVIIREIRDDGTAVVSYMSNPVTKTRHTPVVPLHELSDGTTPSQSALQRARDAEAELDRLRAAKAWDKAEAQGIIFRARVIDFYRESVREADKK